MTKLVGSDTDVDRVAVDRLLCGHPVRLTPQENELVLDRLLVLRDRYPEGKTSHTTDDPYAWWSRRTPFWQTVELVAQALDTTPDQVMRALARYRARLNTRRRREQREAA